MIDAKQKQLGCRTLSISCFSLTPCGLGEYASRVSSAVIDIGMQNKLSCWDARGCAADCKREPLLQCLSYAPAAAVLLPHELCTLSATVTLLPLVH